jgi:hypothetical protein
VESQKPQSTLSYITNKGESAFVQVNGSDLKLRDLKVFTTNRPEDKEMFKELRALAQPAMQNGASLYDIIDLYSTDSIRQMKRIFKSLKERQEGMQNQQLQQQQQEMEQNSQIAQAQLQQAQQQHEEQIAHDDYQKELDRISKEKIAIIQATGFGKVESEDINQNNIPDVLETQKFAHEQQIAAKDYQLKLADISNKNKKAQDDSVLAREKLGVEKQKMQNDLMIAKINAKTKAKAAKKSSKKK